MKVQGYQVQVPIERFEEWVTSRAVNSKMINESNQTLTVDNVTYDNLDGYVVVDGNVLTQEMN